jgi:putative transposase
MLEGWPFHLTHRGNQRCAVFRSDGDRRLYLRLLRRYAVKFDMRIWAYCLMPNHVHLIAVGAQRSSISKAIGNTHRAYSRCLNNTQEVTGHLWANRFYSTALDEPHLWAAVRYVELNPVRARIVGRAADYPWSSARAHADETVDRLLDPDRPFPGPVSDWAGWLATGLEQETAERLRKNTSTGRPTGSDEFVRELEDRLGHRLKRAKPARDTLARQTGQRGKA